MKINFHPKEILIKKIQKYKKGLYRTFATVRIESFLHHILPRIFSTSRCS